MYDTYVIKEDDTIDSIASKYGISPEILRELNGYIFNLIPGNSLVVPRRKNDYFDYYTVIKGDTLYKIASDNNIDPSLLAQLNGINKSDYIYHTSHPHIHINSSEIIRPLISV
jgi:LysM repeat protein